MATQRKGVFFDLDGTLADSMPMFKQVFFDYLTRYKLSGSDEDFYSLIGPPIHEVARELQQRYHLTASLDELVAQYNALIQEGFVNVRPCDGALELLQLAKQQQWYVAIVTSNSVSIAHDWLEKTQLLSYIDLMIGQEMVVQGKPHPEPYLKALQQSPCELVNVIAVEDSIQGAHAARAAGMTTYLINTDYAGANQALEDIKRIEHLRDLIPLFAED